MRVNPLPASPLSSTPYQTHCQAPAGVAGDANWPSQQPMDPRTANYFLSPPKLVALLLGACLLSPLVAGAGVTLSIMLLLACLPLAFPVGFIILYFQSFMCV